MTDSPLTLAIAHLRYGVYTCAAAGTVLLYDILLTSEDEIRLIWPSRFSLAKFLYFMVRPNPPTIGTDHSRYLLLYQSRIVTFPFRVSFWGCIVRVAPCLLPGETLTATFIDLANLRGPLSTDVSTYPCR